MSRLYAGAILLLWIAACAEADVIHLKSGRKIECDSAWEEGKEVRYVIAEGTVGIPRSMVDRIVKAEPAPPPPPPAASVAAETQAVVTQTAPAAAPQSQPASTEAAQSSQLKLAKSYSTLGKALMDKKDYVGALEYLKKAYEQVKSSETIFQLALNYYLLKDDWNASLLFNELLRKEPNNTTALNYLGEMAWRKENLDEAQSYWERSYRITPDPEIRQKLSSLGKEKKASDAYDDSNTRHFLVKYDGGMADTVLVDQIISFLEATYQELSVQLEEYPTVPFVVVLYPQKDYFNITEAPFWSGGVNDGKIKLPVRGIKELTPEIQQVLVHELVHSFVDLKTEGNCPVWLHEGLAQYLEGKRPGADAAEGLRRMADARALPAMSRLSGSFMNANSNQASMLYLLSLSFTQFLIERYRFFELTYLLENLGKGESLNRAFENTYLVPISQVEEEWRRSLIE